MKRPNWSNEQDACCVCGKLFATPGPDADLAADPVEGELSVWQPASTDPPQWICGPCKGQLTEDERRGA